MTTAPDQRTSISQAILASIVESWPPAPRQDVIPIQA